MQGGYGAIAHELRQLTGHPYSRQQVHAWNKRRTENAAGRPFPSPVRAHRNAKPPQVRLEFDLDQVLAWMAAGIPEVYGHEWRPGIPGTDPVLT